MKHLDWKATARRMSLQTKVFEPAASLNLMVAVNAATGEHPWQGSSPRLFERGVTTAASVCKYAADRRYSFGLISNAVAAYSGKWLNVPIGRSAAQLGLVLEALALAGPYFIFSLVEVLRQERDSIPPGATIFLVTSVIPASLAAEVSEPPFPRST